MKTISAGSSAGSAVTVMEPSTPISVLLEFNSKYISVVLKNGNEFWCKLYDYTGKKSSKINIDLPVKKNGLVMNSLICLFQCSDLYSMNSGLSVYGSQL